MACRRRRRDLQGAQRRNSENPFSRHIISFPNCLYDRQSNAFGVALVFACFKGKKKTKRAGARLAAGAEGGTCKERSDGTAKTPFRVTLFLFPTVCTTDKAMPLALLWFLLVLKARKKPNEPGRAWLLVPKAGLEPARCCQQRILSPSRLPFHHFGNFYRKIISQISELVNCLT